MFDVVVSQSFCFLFNSSFLYVFLNFVNIWMSSSVHLLKAFMHFIHIQLQRIYRLNSLFVCKEPFIYLSSTLFTIYPFLSLSLWIFVHSTQFIILLKVPFICEAFIRYLCLLCMKIISVIINGMPVRHSLFFSIVNMCVCVCISFQSI